MTMLGTCDVSVAICTLNRCQALELALASVLAQGTDGPHYEVIVVDNGSTDRTRDTVERLIGRYAVDIRYTYEPRRGLAYARNAAIRAARAPIVAFTDDDQEVVSDWVSVLWRTLQQHPDIDAVGGRVHPVWSSEPPHWLTDGHRGPLSLIDRGPEPFHVNSRRWMCLSGGNFACRREILELLGGYSPDYPRSQDREFLVRLLQAGRQAFYQPRMIAFHHIESRRLTKAYFRQWHWMEGRMRAGFRFEEIFDTSGQMWDAARCKRQVLGVAAFVYPALAAEIAAAFHAAARGCTADAFRREGRVLYLVSYIGRRWELYLKGRRHALGERLERIQPAIQAGGPSPR